MSVKSAGGNGMATPSGARFTAVITASGGGASSIANSSIENSSMLSMSPIAIDKSELSFVPSTSTIAFVCSIVCVLSHLLGSFADIVRLIR